MKKTDDYELFLGKTEKKNYLRDSPKEIKIYKSWIKYS